jgi:hypothetical protein
MQRYTIKSTPIKSINIYNADNEYVHSSPKRDLSEDVKSFKYNKVTKELNIILWI